MTRSFFLPAQLLMALAGGWLAARLVGTLLAAHLIAPPELMRGMPAPAKAAAPAQVDVPRTAALLGVPPPRPAKEPEPPWNPVPSRSALPGTVAGTALAEPPRYSLCAVHDAQANRTRVYGVGDEYLGARIYGIERERVLLDHDGRNEYLDTGAATAASPGPVAVKEASPGSYSIPRSLLNGALTNVAKLSTEALVTPAFRNGASIGFRFQSIAPGSIYAAIGLQNGDIVRRLNGYEVTSPDKALELYQKLRDASRIEVELERHGQVERKAYAIE